MFRSGMEIGTVAQRPVFPTLEIRNTCQGFFEAAPCQALLGHLPEDLRPFVTFPSLTGWRKGEARAPSGGKSTSRRGRSDWSRA